MKLPGVALATIEASFNRLLAEQPGIIKPTLYSKCICLDLSGLDLQLYFRFIKKQVILLNEYDRGPDATIKGTPIGLANAGLSGRANTQDMQLSGDLQVAQAFEKLLKDIDPDWEEWLSHVTGDAIAFRIGETVRGLRVWGKQAGEAFAEDLRDYLQIETRQLPIATEVDQFNRDVDELRAAVERFEMRVQRLQRRHHPETA